ncbi:flagellin [Pseudokineococcus marinus]|uniref:Flagellin n=1 Tax=Pseudokineococcus marinus TaxID=351215 RepID=A0A849BJ71_9ACTN|nr:flagellin [Pseudokineococcus marinus]NNH23240.1 flagellin [Pseudokineococcus marinus]
MGFQINNNVAAFNAYRNLSVTQGSVSSSLEKLSSGLRINRAADDAAGLAISEGLRSQVGGLKVAVRNAQDGISVVQTAEGALSTSTSILQRMRDLSVQAANTGGLSDKAKENIQSEVDQLAEELTRISTTTQFNGKNLLDGSYSGAFQVGANGGEQISVAINAGLSTPGDPSTGIGLSAAGLGVAALDMEGPSVASVVTAGVSDNSGTGAARAIELLDTAIQTVSTARADLGAKQNRLEMTIKNLNVSVENLTASESRIRDTDMAQEMVSFTKSQILSQAGTAMLAQANQMGQGVLQLLR